MSREVDECVKRRKNAPQCYHMKFRNFTIENSTINSNLYII